MNIFYNGVNINDGITYIVEESNHEISAKPDINLQKIARTNDSVLLRKNYTTKTINMTLIISDVDKDSLDARIDDFKELIEAPNKNLDIDYAGVQRRFVCTGYIEKIDRHYRWARLTMRFECYRAFSEDTSNTVERFNDKTTSPYTDDIEIGGSAPAQPTITINVNSLTGTGDRFIQIKNTDNGDYVKITANDWAADDVIVISSRNGLVTRNGNVVEYLGIMPDWNPGANNWEYSDDFSARQVDISFSYKKRYL